MIALITAFLAIFSREVRFGGLSHLVKCVVLVACDFRSNCAFGSRDQCALQFITVKNSLPFCRVWPHRVSRLDFGFFLGNAWSLLAFLGCLPFFEYVGAVPSANRKRCAFSWLHLRLGPFTVYLIFPICGQGMIVPVTNYLLWLSSSNCPLGVWLLGSYRPFSFTLSWIRSVIRNSSIFGLFPAMCFASPFRHHGSSRVRGRRCIDISSAA